MKQTPLSNCEKTSVQSSIQSGIRLDGRDFLQVREMAINFGKDYGSCSVVLGHTRVLAQVFLIFFLFFIIEIQILPKNLGCPG